MWSKKIDPYFWLTLLLSLPVVGPLLQPGYFWGAHDARHSVYFLHQFNKAIQDGVWYPRWAPDFAFGYGYPFFNIYGPLSSYAGQGLLLAGLEIVTAVKVIFGLSALLSGLAMYLFARRLLGGPAGLIAALTYVYIPYHLFDLYVRAALAESVGFVFVPLVLWGFYEAVTRPRPGALLWAALAYAGLMFTSNLLALLFTPILGLYVAFMIVGRFIDLAKEKDEAPLAPIDRQTTGGLISGFISGSISGLLSIVDGLLTAVRLQRGTAGSLLGLQARGRVALFGKWGADKKIRRGSPTTPVTPAYDSLRTRAAGWSLTATQLKAIISYEFRLQWRRVALPAVATALIITPLLGVWLSYEEFQGYRAALAAGTLSPAVAQAEITADLIPITWLGITLTAILLIPLVVAEMIPRDRQLGVRDLLDTLLSPGLYLVGKLLSLWLTLLAGVGLAALVSGCAWWLLIGPFRLDIFLDTWLLGGLFLILINGGTTLLLAAGQPTNRRALFIGGGYVLFCLLGLSFIFSTDLSWWRWLNPARPAVMLYYLLGFPDALQGSDELTRAGLAFMQQATSRPAVLASLLAGLGQVVLAGGVAWAWLRRRVS